MSKTLTFFPKIAKKNIESIKLVYRGEVKYYPWFQRMSDNVSYEINKKTTINWSVIDIFDMMIGDTGGGIYSYPFDNIHLSLMDEPFKSTYFRYLRETLIKKDCKEAAVLKCIIPKGTLYYECLDSNNILNIYKMIPQLMSKSIIPIEDITHNLEKLL